MANAVGQPWFGGARTVAEQMLGLGPALAEARGGEILDLGCAEGAIAIEFAKAGASRVLGVDSNAEFISTACKELRKSGPLPVRFELGDVAALPEEEFDIVLALAILHKLPDPVAGVRFCAESARSLIVVRLPLGSTGKIRSKHFRHMSADIPKTMAECGFNCERKEAGPRGEWVHYYRRMPSLE